jgi:hypothetical protein
MCMCKCVCVCVCVSAQHSKIQSKCIQRNLFFGLTSPPRLPTRFGLLLTTLVHVCLLLVLLHRLDTPLPPRARARAHAPPLLLAHAPGHASPGPTTAKATATATATAATALFLIPPLLMQARFVKKRLSGVGLGMVSTVSAVSMAN